MGIVLQFFHIFSFFDMIIIIYNFSSTFLLINFYIKRNFLLISTMKKKINIEYLFRNVASTIKKSKLLLIIIK